MASATPSPTPNPNALKFTLDVRLDDRFVNLVEEGFDVALRIGKLSDSSLVARKLAATRLVTCASPAYLAEHGEPEVPEDLAAHNCLLYSYLATANLWRFTAPDGREISVPVTGNLRANNGIVMLATDGTGGVSATNRSTGAVHLIVDVNGYFK